MAKQCTTRGQESQFDCPCLGCPVHGVGAVNGSMLDQLNAQASLGNCEGREWICVLKDAHARGRRVAREVARDM